MSSRRGGARARALAALAVDMVIGQGRTLDHAFAEVLNGDLADRERAQIKALAFGATRWHHRHRLIIAELLDRPLRARDRILESLLSVGIFELIEARQPSYATVSATVDAIRQLKRPRAAGLVNAALRRFQRDGDALLSQALAHEEGRFAHPAWLIDRIREDWPNDWQTSLTAALEKPPLWLRVNRARTSRDEYIERLKSEADISATTSDAFPDAVRLDKAVAATALPGFADGDVSVQDAAAQVAAELLAPSPGMRVLDACAAPGGKTTHLLERVDGALDLVAVDIDAARNALVEENLQRAGYHAQVVTADAAALSSWAGERRFDRILLDAPCSATGVIRRHPDIKFLRRPEDITTLAQRQIELLESLWTLLEPQGRLLYVTCSILRAENDELVAQFLAAHPEAADVTGDMTGALRYAVDLQGPGRQLLPGRMDTDGFYYALMERRG